MPRFIWPVSNPVFSQHFGDNADWYMRNVGQRGHNGDDIAVPSGTPVHASADGTVFFEGDGARSTWMGAVAGYCVVLDHGDVYTGYAHLRSTVVSNGQKVKQGQLIGYSGATGLTMGGSRPQPHLHFEFIGKPANWNNGYAARVNPANYIMEGDDMAGVITKDEIAQLRVINSEVDGYNRTQTHRGDFDEKEAAGWVGKSWKDFIQTKWEQGAWYRELKDKWEAAYNREPAYKQEIADLKKQLAEALAGKTAPANSNSEADKELKTIKDAAKTLFEALGIK